MKEADRRNTSTIQLKKSVIKALDQLKAYPAQTYDELISMLIDIFRRFKSSDEYKEFMNEIQQHKMKELWDNDEDEAWENA